LGLPQNLWVEKRPSIRHLTVRTAHNGGEAATADEMALSERCDNLDT